MGGKPAERRPFFHGPTFLVSSLAASAKTPRDVRQSAAKPTASSRYGRDDAQGMNAEFRKGSSTHRNHANLYKKRRGSHAIYDKWVPTSRSRRKGITL
jgi:hypothetical protein